MDYSNFGVAFIEIACEAKQARYLAIPGRTPYKSVGLVLIDNVTLYVIC